MLSFLGSLANAILGNTSLASPIASTRRRIAMDADFSERRVPAMKARERFRKIDRIEKLTRFLGEQRSAR
jgi:hypothetical protein